tara:strand:- start:261 stop:548 length:288 start_codon:yes stop_codon:yes gene_type:complete
LLLASGPGAARHQKRTKFREGPDSELPPGSSHPDGSRQAARFRTKFRNVSQAAGKSPIMNFGQRAEASWLRGGLDRHDPQPNKVSGFRHGGSVDC